jgi:hypothetical protein
MVHIVDNHDIEAAPRILDPRAACRKVKIPLIGEPQYVRGRYPQAFIIEIDSDNHVIAPHFHEVDQFQVFVGGDGILGKRQGLSPVTVQYSDAYTPYGPIAPNHGGLAFLTLRPEHDPGVHYVPSGPSELRPRPKRRFVVRYPVTEMGRMSGIESESTEGQPLPEPDGLLAAQFRLAPQDIFVGSSPALGGGQYWLVAKGEVTYDGTDLGAGSLVFLAPADASLSVRARQSGAVLVQLQFGDHSHAIAQP